MLASSHPKMSRRAWLIHEGYINCIPPHQVAAALAREAAVEERFIESRTEELMDEKAAALLVADERAADRALRILINAVNRGNDSHINVAARTVAHLIKTTAQEEAQNEWGTKSWQG